MERIVLVTKPTRLEELIAYHQTRGAVKFFIESQGQSMEMYETEDQAYKRALDLIRKQIPSETALTTVTREHLSHFMFRDDDLIIICGPDGLFVNVAQYLDQQLVLSVNPDPTSVAGVLMLFQASQVGIVLKQVLANKHKQQPLPFIKATVDESQTIWGINDVFLGRRDHASARYAVTWEEETEHQSSSGIIISTGIGATGWLKSIQTMLVKLTGNAGQLKYLPGPSENELVFVTREPFSSPNTGTDLITGRITPDEPLVVVSEMPEGGCIFSDGIVEKGLTWNAGSIVTITVGERFINRIIP